MFRRLQGKMKSHALFQGHFNASISGRKGNFYTLLKPLKEAPQNPKCLSSKEALNFSALQKCFAQGRGLETLQVI